MSHPVSGDREADVARPCKIIMANDNIFLFATSVEPYLGCYVDSTRAQDGRKDAASLLDADAHGEESIVIWLQKEEEPQMKMKVMKFLRDEEGLTIVEYAVAAGLISAAVVASFTLLGTTVDGVIQFLITQL